MIRLCCVPLLLLIGIGCGTETGNPELTVAYNSTTSAPARVSLDATAGTTSVERLWLRLDAVEFDDCDGAAQASLDALGFADHAGPEAARQSLELPEVRYCQLKTRLFAVDPPSDEPTAVAGSSVAVSGTLPDGRAFELVSFTEVPLTLTLDMNSLPDEGAWLITFDLATWLDPIDLASLPGDPVRIDAATQPALLEQFLSGLAGGIEVIEDTNDNGHFDAGETILGGG